MQMHPFLEFGIAYAWSLKNNADFKSADSIKEIDFIKSALNSRDYREAINKREHEEIEQAAMGMAYLKLWDHFDAFLMDHPEIMTRNSNKPWPLLINTVMILNGYTGISPNRKWKPII